MRAYAVRLLRLRRIEFSVHTTSTSDEFTADFGGALEDTSIGDCRVFRLLAKNS
jgi:hypothetical protein